MVWLIQKLLKGSSGIDKHKVEFGGESDGNDTKL